uniref:Uncharacterized protein n=1 Tax=Globodera rostochiensis TaxID=31243 RepID=A0A914H610_GLORO
MDFVRQLFCQKEGCNTTDEFIPDVQQWMKAIDKPSLVLLCAGAGMTGVVLCLSLLHLIFVLKFIKDEQIRTDLYWLVFMAPVVAVCGLVGMVLPRAAIFMYAIALVYYMICIFVLVCLMCTLNGSRKSMCRKLLAKGKRISIRVCPLGCCLFCFDKLQPTEKNFRRFEWLVFQSPIVRILLEILNITVFMELNSRSNLFFQLSNLVGIVSLLIGSYGSYIIVPAGASLLHKYRFLLLFRLVDICQLIWSVQKFIADFIGALNLISSRHDVLNPLPQSAVAQFYICFLLCAEMLLASMLATWWFRPVRCAFFDRLRTAHNAVLEYGGGGGDVGIGGASAMSSSSLSGGGDEEDGSRNTSVECPEAGNVQAARFCADYVQSGCTTFCSSNRFCPLQIKSVLRLWPMQLHQHRRLLLGVVLLLVLLQLDDAQLQQKQQQPPDFNNAQSIVRSEAEWTQQMDEEFVRHNVLPFIRQFRRQLKPPRSIQWAPGGGNLMASEQNNHFQNNGILGDNDGLVFTHVDLDPAEQRKYRKSRSVASLFDLGGLVMRELWKQTKHRCVSCVNGRCQLVDPQCGLPFQLFDEHVEQIYCELILEKKKRQNPVKKASLKAKMKCATFPTTASLPHTLLATNYQKNWKLMCINCTFSQRSEAANNNAAAIGGEEECRRRRRWRHTVVTTVTTVMLLEEQQEEEGTKHGKEEKMTVEDGEEEEEEEKKHGKQEEMTVEEELENGKKEGEEGTKHGKQEEMAVEEEEEMEEEEELDNGKKEGEEGTRHGKEEEEEE